MLLYHQLFQISRQAAILVCRIWDEAAVCIRHTLGWFELSLQVNGSIDMLPLSIGVKAAMYPR
jgi:hypothetical protein